MARAKPYARSNSDNFKRSNPDAPGRWGHDMHENVKSSLASRISSSSSSSSLRTKGGRSLLDRISGGQGKELLGPVSGSGSGSGSGSSASKLHGFGAAAPTNSNNLNAGLELLPSSSSGPGGTLNRAGGGGGGGKSLNKGRLVQSGLDAALGKNQPRRQVVRQVQHQVQPFAGESLSSGVSIMGAARGVTLVRVENLAAGTTAEDVMSAFAPSPMESARVISPSSSPTVTVELEMSTRQAAEDVIGRYDNAVADGNTLRVQIVKQSLSNRIGGGGVGGTANGFGGAAGNGLSSRIGGGGEGRRAAERSNAGQELLSGSGSSKMYSDTILRSDPSAGIITLAEQQRQEQEAQRRGRADAWMRGGPSLSARIGGGGGGGGGFGGGGRSRGRGQIGGGSYADMMVD